MLEPGGDPVHKVSIVPRGQSLGSTYQASEQDRYGYDAAYLRSRIVVALGGRAAEEIVYGDVTTGAEADLEVVTTLARQMVGRWGMSRRVGLVSVLPRLAGGLRPRRATTAGPPRPPRSSWTPRSGCSSTSATPPPSSA